MFITIYKKEKENYYMLTFVFQTNSDKPEFKKIFINEDLANTLIGLGVSVREK